MEDSLSQGLRTRELLDSTEHGLRGLDLFARFNGKYVVGEAKFLSDFGGNQNNSFDDAASIFMDTRIQAVKVAILDGVLYIPNRGKMQVFLTNPGNSGFDIMSTLVLREFLYQL